MRANRHMKNGGWSGEAADRIVLDHGSRHRRRIVMTAEGGLSFLLDLAEAVHLKDGDGLVLEDGRIVEVRAAPEALLAVRGRDARHLTALAWQIGNRHLAAQVEDTRILIRRDHVIAAMLTGLGASVREVVEPFDPEGGAYGGHAHAHDHRHGNGADHGHG